MMISAASASGQTVKQYGGLVKLVSLAHTVELGKPVCAKVARRSARLAGGQLPLCYPMRLMLTRVVPIGAPYPLRRKA